MRHFKSVFVIFILALTTFQTVAAQDTGETPVAKHGQLSVVGPHIRDENGDITSLAGPSFFWSNTGWGQERFYTKGAVETFAKDWNEGSFVLQWEHKVTGVIWKTKQAILTVL